MVLMRWWWSLSSLLSFPVIEDVVGGRRRGRMEMIELSMMKVEMLLTMMMMMVMTVDRMGLI